MGIGMALNLQKHLQESKQPSLHYSNRTLSKGDSLKAAGGVEESDYAALVKSCDIIFTMASLFSCGSQSHMLIHPSDFK
jgi:3-hydroxyisobutyrate dehydrogenase-like beta-hydroxyacid dehydrogenase